MFKSQNRCEFERQLRSLPLPKSQNDDSVRSSPSSPSRLSRRRLRLNNEFRERLAHLYMDTIHTQVEIVEILNNEFELALKLPRLKKELRKLGLRRNKQRLNPTPACSNSGRRPSLQSESSSCSNVSSSATSTNVSFTENFSNTFPAPSFDAYEFGVFDDNHPAYLLDGTVNYPQTIDFDVDPASVPRVVGEESEDATLGFIHALFPDLDCEEILNPDAAKANLMDHVMLDWDD